MNTKNIIIIAGVLLLAAGAWATSSWVLAPHRAPAPAETITAPSTPESTATTTQATATSSVAAIPPKKVVPPARIMVDKTLFNYDIILGKTPCNDKIGSFTVSSSDPSKKLYWGMTGAKPIWLTFSNVEGATPATVDMIYNCIMSGAEDTINWRFMIVEMTKEGKYIDGYYRAVDLKGDIK